MRRLETRILIVEDNADTRYVLQHVLAIGGYASVAASSGAEALRHLRQGNQVCAIILDLHLPDVDGRTLLRDLKADPAVARIPVIVYSGDSGDVPPDAAACVRKGTDDPDVLLGAIAACLNGTPPPSS